MRLKPLIHGRDHEHGGTDPTRIVYEDVGGGGGGGGGALPGEGERFGGATPNTAGAFASSLFTWNHQAGSTFLDLTDPQRPETITAGVYAISGIAKVLEAVTPGRYWELQASYAATSSHEVDMIFPAPQVHDPVGFGPSIVFAMTMQFDAADRIQFTANNRDTVSHTFVIFGALVQRIL